MSKLIEATIQDVRQMAYRLRPRVLDDLGLTDALESLVSDFEKRSDLSCIFRHADIPEIDKTLATTLYRVAQEALTNALRHARAATILVELKTRGSDIILTVRDDGCGFRPDSREAQKGFGLESMTERTSLVGGQLHIRSAPDQGTLISCRINFGRYI